MMRPAARMGLLIVLTIGGVLPVATFLTVPAAHGMVRFNSYLELQRFLLLESNCRYNYGTGYGWTAPPTAGPIALANRFSANSADSSPVNAVPSHSETNNQVAGVDELDTVKSDGQYIYTVTNNTVAIVDAYPVNNAQLVSRISVGNQSIDGIFVSGSRLSIVTEAPRNFYYGYASCGGPLLGAGTSFAPMVPQCLGCIRSWVPQEQNTSLIVYDLTNHSSPTLQTRLTVNGTFVGSRRIGDVVYLVSSGPARYNDTLPAMVLNGRKTEIPATQIYHSDVGDKAFSYTTVVALNMIQDNASPILQSYLLGTSSTIYVSLTNIFLTQPVWDGSGETVIHRISITDSSIKYEASGIVPGHVLNQFSMDEDNGHFRVVTSSNSWSNGMTNLYVLDLSMKIIGRLDGISPGETFHAARFMGDKAYLVTFKRMDPLFVIDLKDPANPTMLGQLNVTGVSDYLQPYDSSHLIGIGKSAEDVAWENAARFFGLKISLFDVTDPHRPTDLSDFTIGEHGTSSPALTDAKAVLFDRSLNLLVIPIEVWGQGPSNGYYPYTQAVSQGAYVFQVSSEHGIVFRGAISHFPDQVPVDRVVSAYYVTRSLYIGNVLYTISGAMVKMNSLADLSSLGSVNLV